jgi:PAS domain S-box-containing protein
MVTASILIVGITIGILYSTSISEQRSRLWETAIAQARLIESISRHNARHTKSYDSNAYINETLALIIEAHRNYELSHKSMELTLARLQNDEIVFLLRHGHEHQKVEEVLKPVKLDSNIALPMKEALKGRSGTMIGKDYLGNEVVAAFQPIFPLQMGIVVKINLSEIQVPFIKAALIAIFSSAFIIIAGTFLIYQITNPIIYELKAKNISLEKMNKILHETQKNLKKNEKKLKNAQELARLAYFEYNVKTKEISFSDEIYRLMGYDIKNAKLNLEMFLNYFHSADRNKIQQLILGKDVDNLIKSSYEFNIVNKRKEKIILNAQLDAERDEKKEIVRIMGIFQNITEKKSLEKILFNAIEEERRRIGRDLHDGLGQKLTGLSFIVGSLKSKLLRKKYPEPTEFDDALNLIKEATTDSQALSKGLYPFKLKENNIVKILNDLASSARNTFKIQCRVICLIPIIIIDEKINAHIYFIVNEAINNALKHGNATEIIISLFWKERYLNIDIQDNGKSARKSKKAATANSGIGLKTMEYRANIIGGEFSTEKGKGKGFHVSLRIKI